VSQRQRLSLTTVAALVAATVVATSVGCARQEGAGAPDPSTPSTPSAQSGSTTGVSGATVGAGAPASDFSARDIEGKNVKLSTYLGKQVVLLNFCATWCEPCVAEFPHLRKMYEANKAKGFVILAIAMDGSTRYRNAIYPAKLFLTYKTEGLEVTAGDAYVQFGRGLVLSMRKVDELGIDTTLLGAKVVANKDVFALTLIGGIANVARVDEPSGRALFLPNAVNNDLRAVTPLFGNDRIVGASLTAGRGQPVVLSTNGVLLGRCAPYSYDANGLVNNSTFDAPFGTCNDSDRATFLATLPVLNRARQTVNASQTFEIPNLWSPDAGKCRGKRALRVARQRGRAGDQHRRDEELPELPSARSVGEPLARVGVREHRVLSAAHRRAHHRRLAVPRLQRLRDRRTRPARLPAQRTGPGLRHVRLLRHEVGAATGGCDRFGRSIATDKDGTEDFVSDASIGTEWRFDDDKSIAFLNLNGRHDEKANGDFYYDELAIQYSITKHIKGPYSLELAGRHR
jgi:thiol-disulfide isomerase/thioredoxin